MSRSSAKIERWPLLAIPNFSAAREPSTVAAIAASLSTPAGVSLLDIHSDADHNRSVFTLAGSAPGLVDALVAAAETAIEKIDLNTHEGRHPRVGALDVAPFVHMEPSCRGAACAAALTLADRLATELKLPVFLYGELTEFKRTRADLRRGGPAELQRRIDAGELKPDFGPTQLHPTAGAALVASRAPLVAFNLVLAPRRADVGSALGSGAQDDMTCARQIAAAIREGGSEGLPTVRAIAVELSSQAKDRVQVSTNIENYLRTSPVQVLEAVSRYAQVESVEFVGLPPSAALVGLPETVQIQCHGELEAAISRG